MSPSGKIGAFFDIDGTLLPSPSLEWRFIAYLLSYEMEVRDVTRWLGAFAKTFLRDPRAATSGNKRYLSGMRMSLIADWENALAPDAPRFFAAGIERIAWHVAQGHQVFLVSGTLEPLANIVARHLPGRVEVRATKLETRNGQWTGRLAGEHLGFEEKARTVQSLAAQHDLQLDECYAYGNRIADLGMLQLVGHPVAVNPRGRLVRIAQSMVTPGSHPQWQIRRWTDPLLARPAQRAVEISPGETR
jgi:alcohol-forming fatty acyl-CoA reductase